MVMNNKTLRPRQSSATYHAEAKSWKARAVANGGTVSAGTMQAVSDFCAAIDDIGTMRSAFLRLNLVCGNNLAAALTPLYRGPSASGTQYGSPADINNGPYVANDYSEATGLTGNGTSKYVDTTIDLSHLVAVGADYDNVHCSSYIRSVVGFDPFFGGSDDNGDYENEALLLFAGVFQTGDRDATHYVSANGGNGLQLGLFITAGSGQFCINGVNGGSVTNTGGATFGLSSMPLYFGGAWSSGGNYYTTSVLSAYSVGLASGTDMQASGGRVGFYNAMQAFQSALGRSV